MRLFLALSPPDDLRRQLGAQADRLHRVYGGRRVPDANLHLTLAFLGEQSEEQAQALSTWLDRLQVAPGSISLDHLGHFRGSGIIWIGPQQTPDALQRLQADISHELRGMGINHQPRHFRPHITLLRKASRGPTGNPPDKVRYWSYARVELIQSTQDTYGSHYRSLASTPQRG